MISSEQERVRKYLLEVSGETVNGEEDPIGALISSHEILFNECLTYRQAMEDAAQAELVNIVSRMKRPNFQQDPEWQQP